MYQCTHVRSHCTASNLLFNIRLGFLKLPTNLGSVQHYIWDWYVNMFYNWRNRWHDAKYLTCRANCSPCVIILRVIFNTSPWNPHPGTGHYISPLPRDFQSSSDLIENRPVTRTMEFNKLEFDFAAKLLQLRTRTWWLILSSRVHVLRVVT